jgi:hypothetical protein
MASRRCRSPPPPRNPSPSGVDGQPRPQTPANLALRLSFYLLSTPIPASPRSLHSCARCLCTSIFAAAWGKDDGEVEHDVSDLKKATIVFLSLHRRCRSFCSTRWVLFFFPDRVWLPPIARFAVWMVFSYRSDMCLFFLYQSMRNCLIWFSCSP